MSDRRELDKLMGQLEEMWAHQDILFARVEAEGLWDRPHGPDWTFADVPYHLAYCNEDLVIRPMELGPDLPEKERLALDGVEGVHAWNGQKFAERPAGQTGSESVAQLHASWDRIRALSSEMNDADLERPFWMAFNGGEWLTTMAGLLFCRNHDWSEFMQLRIHLGLSEPVPSPEITTEYVQLVGNLVFPMALNQEAAQGRTFKAAMAFTDPGVNGFTIAVSDGAATIVPGQAEDADLVITQSAETLEKGLRGIQPMPEAMQSGAVQVSNMESLATFGQLFPMG